ncbi:hypothetical protein [Lentzea sp. CC55]|uniref:hypothetical protein n=1 Tax=Lentzea sp. CC55 TaxID=2884909 RepID=UPI001F198511|nr:hypothetical protein [Lentzea sp. CC55]MCG8926663.1 hypothetical protein [Lentzea sp. CC55]
MIASEQHAEEIVMRITVTVCDICQDADRETRTWQLRNVGEGTAGNVDLCEEHEQPLVALLEKAPKANITTRKTKARGGGTTTPKARYRPHGIAVTTPEEIERLKRKQDS